MMGLLKFIGRWVFRGFIVLVILVIALILAKDRIFRSVVEKRLQESTGLKVTLRAAEFELLTGKMRFDGLRMANPAEFGDSLFLDLEQLELEMDRGSLKKRELYFRLLHINLSQLTIVEDKQGRLNLQAIRSQLEARSKESKPGKEKEADNKPSLPFKFSGVETLKLSLGKVRKINLNYPDKPVDTDLGVQNQVMKDIKTQEDFQNKVLPVLLRGGIAAVYQIWRN